jgi:hypothetical protein
MKFRKFVFGIVFIFFNFLQIPAFAETTLTSQISLDWPLLNQQERDKTISFYQSFLFQNVSKTINKDSFANFKKDKDRDLNRYFLKNNMLSLPDKKLAGFYMFNNIMVIYAIKYENNKKNIYYYDALGNLIYYDILEKPYDQYPYKAYQYNKKGNLVGVSYYISEDDQYAFKADGKFYCRWYQDKCYDKKAKKTIKRKIID